MILEYNVTQRDYENVIYGELKKQRGSKLGCLLPAYLILVVFTIIPMFFWQSEDYLLIPVYIVMIIIISLLVIFTRKRMRAKLMLRGRIKSGGVDPQYFGPHRLEVTDDRLLVRYGDIEGERMYGGIDHVSEYQGAVGIFLNSAACDIVPDSAFKDVEQRNTFISLLQSKMAAAKDVPIDGETVDASRSNAIYTIDYAWDEESLTDAMVAGNRTIHKTRVIWSPARIIITIFGLLLIFRGITGIAEIMMHPAVDSIYSSTYSTAYILYLVFGIIMNINLIIVFTPWIRSISLKQIRNGAVKRDMVGNHTMCFYEDKITVFSRLTKQDLHMGQIYRAERRGNVLFMLMKARSFIPVPVSAFGSDEKLNEMQAFVNSRITK